MKILKSIHNFLSSLRNIDFIGLLFIRMYLFNVMWFAGTGKILNIDKFSGWLGTLGVPLPEIVTWMVIITEAGGAVLLLTGLFVRWASIPLLITMFFAGYLVHADNGWSHENNGIELAVTYSLMLLILLFQGGGRFISLDYWVSNKK
jgi:putative oxidoreductase